MKPILHKGKLTTWKDDRGFGFIKPSQPVDGNKEIFLHISQLKGRSRRPQVGDTIFYELKTDADGKLCGVNASIEGVAPQQLPQKQSTKTPQLLQTIIGICVLAGIGIFSMDFSSSRPSPTTSASPTRLIPKPGCNIKGNISITTGNRLYHLPGMEDYETTRIEPKHGERWFCTEAEAIAAGWRKAPR